MLPQSATWAASLNPNNTTVFVANRAMTIEAVIGVAEVANGAAATVTVVKASSGTLASAGTPIHSGSVNANGTAGINQNLTLTITAMNAGDRLVLQTTGTWTNAVGNITVFVKWDADPIHAGGTATTASGTTTSDDCGQRFSERRDSGA
jgi:hypothetical protein